jgi:uncharacterized protein YehS (DUF1456 family)
MNKESVVNNHIEFKRISVSSENKLEDIKRLLCIYKISFSKLTFDAILRQRFINSFITCFMKKNLIQMKGGNFSRWI